MSKFIVLEGLDGSGKGTQIELLRKYLTDNGKRVVVIDFPDYASDGSMLVRMYLDGKLGKNPSDTNAYAASMFFAADRYVSYVTGWREDYLRDDTYIIANRYTTANAYHQLSKMPKEDCLVVVLNIDDTQLGLLVDAVDQMIDIPNSALHPVPAQNAQVLVSEMCTIPDGSGTMLVLDCEQLFNHD